MATCLIRPSLYCLIHLSKMLAPNFFCGSWDQFESMGAPDTLICTAKLVASYLLLTKSPLVITCISHSEGKAGLDFDIVCEAHFFFLFLLKENRPYTRKSKTRLGYYDVTARLILLMICLVILLFFTICCMLFVICFFIIC